MSITQGEKEENKKIKKLLTIEKGYCILIHVLRNTKHIRNAGVAELADAQASGACGR